MGYLSNKHFTHAINLYGWDNFKHEILFENLTREEACEKEKCLIAKYKSNDPLHGYNHSSGGENPSEGVKLSEEARRNISSGLKGKKHRDGTGEAISKAKKGRPNGLNGRIGEKCVKAGRLIQKDEATGKVIAVFYGYNEMSRETGYARTPVKEAVYGIRKRAYGYLWEYQKRGKGHVTI